MNGELMQTITTVDDKLSVCTEAMLEQSVLIHPLMPYKNNIVLQEVVLYITVRMVRKRQVTNHHRLKPCGWFEMNLTQSEGTNP